MKIQKIYEVIISSLKQSYKQSESSVILFGIFGIINYPVFYYIWKYLGYTTYDDFTMRVVATFLCIFLILKDYWPIKLQPYFYLYWYFAVGYCLPFIGTYMFLQTQGSSAWSLNIILGLFWLILVLDWVSFCVILPLGTIIAIIYYYIFNGLPIIQGDNTTLVSIFINLIWVIVIAIVFSRKKDLVKLEEVSKLNIELTRALATKTEFLNNMSHEIRTPIQGFTTISEGLVEHWREFSDIRKFELATQVSNNASRLSSLLSHLLDLAKFNAGKMLLDLKPCNLNELIAEITLECRELYLNGKQLDIQFTEVDIPPIMIDIECMGQVLRNLLINAIKFSPNNSVVTIDLKATEISYDNDTQTKALHFTIKDQGVGIPADELNSIFAPFTQSTRTKTKAGGTGLGLAIAREIIEAHHGKIWAENNLDQGSSFHFIIPVHQSELLDNHKIIAEEVSKINQETKEEITLPKTILMIDDEEACLISMELLLHNSSYQLVKAISGEEGLKYLKNHPNDIDLILLDLMIPDMYGLNILTEIKQDSSLASIPVILQSGTSDSEGIKKAYELGIISYIKKPYQKQIIFIELNKAFM